MPRADLSDPTQAIDLQGRLAQRGEHRMPLVALIVAATAAEHGLTVLHYDPDFVLLSEVTGGTHEWVVPAR
jgi:predicted nucleic acid-binding protein